MSPITIVRLPSRLNPAQLVSPMGGVIFTPAVVMDKSFRGTVTLNTRSFSLSVPFTPVSSSMRWVSSLEPLPLFFGAASATAHSPSIATISTIRFIIDFSPLLQRRRGQVVEINDRIRFGPEADSPWIREGFVLRIDYFLVVKEDLEVVAFGFHRQVVPDAAGDLAIPPREFSPVPFHHVVEANVVLERVGADDVIIVRVLEPEHESATLVHLPGDRLAFHRQAQVLHLGAGEGNGKTIVGIVSAYLREDIGFARCIVFSTDHPLPVGALSGASEGKTGWRLADRIRIEIPCLRRRLFIPTLRKHQRAETQRAGTQDVCEFHFTLSFS